MSREELVNLCPIPDLKPTNQELELEVVALRQRAVEGDSHQELLTAADHQVGGVVGGRLVLRFVHLLTHVDHLHRQIR